MFFPLLHQVQQYLRGHKLRNESLGRIINRATNCRLRALKRFHIFEQSMFYYFFNITQQEKTSSSYREFQSRLSGIYRLFTPKYNPQQYQIFNIDLEYRFMFENRLREVLTDLARYEEKIETYRQLLNQEIQFNLKDLYMLVCGRSTVVTAYHLHVFLDEGEITVDLRLLESMIKGYNDCSSMNLTFMEFSLIFLSRQNRLLSKLALQRDSLGQIPPYLLTYARKIIQLETELHSILIDFRQNFSHQAENWIKKYSRINQDVGEEEFLLPVLQKMCHEMEINEDIVRQYFAVNAVEIIKPSKMLSLLTLKNCENVQKYLKETQKKKQHQKKINEPGQHTDPFIRPQFHDCLNRPKTTDLFSYREVKSIQKHLERLNSRNKRQLTQKITRFRKLVEKQLILTCDAIKEIIWLEKEIEYERIQLCLCTDFYPILFFESFQTDREGLLIPSALQDYLKKMGISLPLSELYLLFKKYSDRVDGKLHFNQFCQIFDVCNSDYLRIEKNREIKGLQDVDLDTKKRFFKLIKILVKNQLKIEKIKAKLQEKQVNLRDVFSIFDSDQDGFISQLDFRMAWKKFLLMDLCQEDTAILWHRMGKPQREDAMIGYDRFINELSPRAKWVGKKEKMRPNSRPKTRK